MHLTSLLLLPDLIFGSFIFEPSIQCTITKVHSTVKILDLNQFPVLYQTINNNPSESKLIIAGQEYKELSPEIIVKSEKLERIMIKHKGGQLELEINGIPISRNGVIRESGKIIAEITCH